MANPILTSLPEYVEQNKIGLIAASVLGAKTASQFNFQSGVKGVAAINLLNTDVQFGDGSDCGWNEAGSQTLSQRNITTGAIKVNMAYCDKKMIKTYAEHGVKVAAGQKTLPFEQDFINGVVDNVKAALETALWQGDKASSNANLNKFDGMLKILAAEDGVIEVTGGTSAYGAIKAAIAALPSAAIKEDTRVYVGADTFVKFIQEMVDANLYHYSADNTNGEFVMPGTTIKVVALDGLNGTKKIVAGRASNFFYGADMEGDEEKFEFWYSQDNREFRLAIEFNAGVQVAFPDLVVVATLS